MLQINRLASSLRLRLRAVRNPVSSPKPLVSRCARHAVPEPREAEENILQSLHTTLEYMQGDLTGTWICCNCNTQERIVVTSCEQPLGRLLCTKCDHIWCTDCHTQKAGFLSKLPQKGIVWELSDWTSELYVALCTDCGVTRRLGGHPKECEGPVCIDLDLSNLNCECALSPAAKSDWMPLKVGTGSKKYHDPQEVLRQIKEIFDDDFVLQPPASTLAAQTFFGVPASVLEE
jgi:hypothetical protein